MLAVMRAPLHSEIAAPVLFIATCAQAERALAPMVKACQAAARVIANTPRAKQQRAKIENAKALCMTYREQLALVTSEATSAKQEPSQQQPPGIAWHVSSNAPNCHGSFSGLPKGQLVTS
jgi:hypothetical protein